MYLRDKFKIHKKKEKKWNRIGGITERRKLFWQFRIFVVVHYSIVEKKKKTNLQTHKPTAK